MQTTVQAQSVLSPDQVTKTILEVATDYSSRGPGWAQERPVLREVAERLHVTGRIVDGKQEDIANQQCILTCWHNLFLKGTLSWGYNLDNPGSPWFHFSGPVPTAN